MGTTLTKPQAYANGNCISDTGPPYGYSIKNGSQKDTSSKGSPLALLSPLLMFSLCHALKTPATSQVLGPGTRGRTACDSTSPASQSIPQTQLRRSMTCTVPMILQSVPPIEKSPCENKHLDNSSFWIMEE